MVAAEHECQQLCVLYNKRYAKSIFVLIPFVLSFRPLLSINPFTHILKNHNTDTEQSTEELDRVEGLMAFCQNTLDKLKRNTKKYITPNLFSF